MAPSTTFGRGTPPAQTHQGRASAGGRNAVLAIKPPAWRPGAASQDRVVTEVFAPLLVDPTHPRAQTRSHRLTETGGKGAPPAARTPPVAPVEPVAAGVYDPERSVSIVGAAVGLLRFVLVDAIPGVLSGGKTAIEKQAVSFLRTIVTAQDYSRSKAILDPDGDGLATLVELALGLDPEDAEQRPFLASMGIYVFDYARLMDLLESNPDAMDFGGDILPAAIERYNVRAHVFSEYWEDIGTIKAFYEANLDLASPLPKFNFFDSAAPIYTRSRYLPPSKLHGCDIDNSMVSEGCILNGVYVRNSIIGLRSRIDSGSRIEDTIIMGSDQFDTVEDMRSDIVEGLPPVGIGGGTMIRRAIIDKNVRIGRNVRLTNEGGAVNLDGPGGSYYIRDRIIIVPKYSSIPDGTVV